MFNPIPIPFGLVEKNFENTLYRLVFRQVSSLRSIHWLRLGELPSPIETFFARLTKKHGLQFVFAFRLKIHTPLDKGAVQFELIGKAALDKVVLQIAPANLQEEPPADLKFETTLHLVAPI